MNQNLNESSLSRIWANTQKYECACITAFRGEKSQSENKANNGKLKDLLLYKNYGVTKVVGSYVEVDKDSGKNRTVKEVSFFLTNLQDDPKFFAAVIALGQKFDQDSVLLIPRGGKGAYLVGTTDRDIWIKKNQKQVVGDATYGKAQTEFLSRIGGRAFEFIDGSEKLEESVLPLNNMSRYGYRVKEEKLIAEIFGNL